MSHRIPIKVRFYELDPYNHLNHATYVQYFEVGRVELLESIGLGLTALQEQGIQIVITDLHTRFLASAGPLDELVVETEVGEVRRASTSWTQRLLRGDQILATQEITAAITDTSGRPVRMPEQLAATLEALINR
jgi:acyl-CoA thioester hydrolase